MRRNLIRVSSFHALVPNRSWVSGRVKSNAVVVPPTMSIKPVSNSTSAGQSLSLNFKSFIKTVEERVRGGVKRSSIC